MSECKVIEGNFNTSLDLPVEAVREFAEKNCEKMLIIGVGKDGKPYYASSFTDGQEMLWMIEQFKAKLLSGKFS